MQYAQAAFARARLPNFDTQAVLVERLQSRHQLIEIARHPLYGNQLYLDGDLQISESDQIYGTAMVSPISAIPRCRRVAILGGGDGGVLSELLRLSSAFPSTLESISVVEMDPEVIVLSRRHLKAICGRAFDHPLVTVAVGDALAYIKTVQGLDAVICDLTTKPLGARESDGEFIPALVEAMAAALRPGGHVSIQGGASGPDEPVHALAAAFEASFVDVMEQSVLIPSYERLCSFIAARKPKGPAILGLRLR